MNNKIPLKKFAEAFSKESNISEAEAEAFIKNLFDIVSSELKEGSKVKIHGIGTFSLSASANEPVVFVPDEVFAQEINAPFSIFQPVPLAEGVTEEILSQVEVPELPQPQPEEKLQQEPKTEPKDASEVKLAVPETVNAPESAPAAIDASEIEIKPVIEVVQHIESVKDVDVEQPGQPDENPETLSETAPVKPAETPAPEIPDETTPAPTAVPEWEYEDEEYVQPEETKSKFGAGFVIGLIVGLAIGALVLCAYILYYVNATPQDNSVETELIESHISPVQE